MKKKVVNKLLALMLCASMVGTLAPVSMAQVHAGVESTDAQVSNLKEGEVVAETTLGFEQAFAEVNKLLKAVVTNAPTGTTYTYSWVVGGRQQSTITGDTYTPTQSDLENFIEVTAYDTTGKSYTARTYFSKLPVVYVDTDNYQPIKDKNTYLPGTITVQGNTRFSDSKLLYSGITEIKGRGNSTWGMPKKPYKLKLDKKADLFGFGKNKHWTLLANYLDPTLSRNKLSYDFSGFMDMPQMQSENVVLILNGQFQGAYQLCEHIRVDTDGNRIDITDWETLAEDIVKAIGKVETTLDKETKNNFEDAMKEDLSWVTSGTFTFNNKAYTISEYYKDAIPNLEGGYLLELDEYYDEVSKFRSSLNQPIMFNVPEFAVSNPEMVGYVTDYINAFEAAIQSDDGYATYKGVQKHYTELFDMDSLVKYWLVNELFFNEDAMKKSTYLYKDHGQLMKMGPIWDMDWAAGGLQGNSKRTDQWQTLFFNGNAQARQWYKQIVKDPYFAMKAVEIYQQYRDYMGSIVANAGLMDTAKEYLQEAGAANDKVWFNGSGYIGETAKLKTWLSARLGWLDQQFASIDLLLQSLQAYNSNQQSTSKLGIDGVVNNDDGSLTVNATLKSGSTNEAKFYVNGILAGTGTKGTDNRVTVTIPADKVEPGVVNMIVVRAFSSWATYSDYKTYTPDTGDGSTVVSKNALMAAINLAKAKIADNYTPDSFANLQTKITAAETIRDNTEATQAQVNTATTELNAAISALVSVTPVVPSEPTELSTEGMTATAGIEEELSNKNTNQGPASFVLDGNTSTMWHTPWNGSDRAKHYIDINLGGSYQISGLKMVPRQSGYNGIILKYEVLTSTDGTTFTSQASGEWVTNNPFDTHYATFGKEVTATHVRLVSKDSYSSDPNKEFSSAAEIRILGIEQSTVTVNKAVLQQRIASAEALVEEQYTVDSFKAVKEALANANTINAKTDATQDQVDEAIRALNNAIKALASVTSNKENLKKLIDSASALTADTYTTDSFAALTRTIKAADDVYKNAEATVDEIAEAIEALTRAVDSLKTKANKTALAAKIAEAQGYAATKDQYTTLTYRQIEIALDSATVTNSNENAIQSEVDARVTDLDRAIKGLQKKADYTALNAKITSVASLKEADYTSESWGVFQQALNNANVEAENLDATQAMLDEALARLTSAVTALVDKSAPAVDKAKLIETIQKAEQKTQKDFTANTWIEFAGALRDAIAIRDSKLATQAQVDAADANLKTYLAVIKAGWGKDANGTYYVKDNLQKAENQWLSIGGSWYYFKGIYKQTGWLKVGATWYYMNKDGKMMTGWQKVGTAWYYLGAASSGKMVTGWQKIGGTWYLFEAGGKMLTGWQKSGNTWYYLGAASSGKMVTGWQKIGGAWYLFNAGGKMLTGWQKSGSSWYYLEGSGKMATGWKKVGGAWYYLTSGGKMDTGWVKDNTDWYFMASSGKMVTGWIRNNGHEYYLYPSGKMAKNTWIGKYFVNGSGIWSATR